MVADLLPEYHARERHSLRVDAVAERAVAAAREVRVEEAPLLGMLFRLRGLPTSGPILEGMLALGFRILADEPGRGFVFGAIGRPWRRGGGLRDFDDFASFDQPGWAKIAGDFRFDDGVLSTETRVSLTDDAARRAFRRYWFAIRPFSGLTRRSWLAAAKRRAEGRL